MSVNTELSGSPESPRQVSVFNALPPITNLNRGLYELVIYVLGAALLLLILGWVVITAVGKTVPEGVPVVIATIVGGLVGVISTSKTTP